MKSFLLALFISISSSSGYCQNAVSFYFTAPLPVSSKSLNEIPAKFCGVYLNEKDTLVKLIIEKDKIWVKHSILIVAKETDLSSKPGVKIENELIHGLMPGQPVPYIRQRDTIYTAIWQKDAFFDFERGDELRQQKNHLVLNYKDADGLFTLIVLSFDGNRLELNELDIDKNLPFLKENLSLEQKSDNGLIIYLATPEKKDFDLLLKTTNILTTGVAYLKR